LELRHLRYFVAVAEARSLKLAAEGKLHTTQPSLSRQIRDLEEEIGTPLLVRGAKGVELTPAGRVFLDHARIMLSQAEAAVQSARQIARPVRPSFALGFMIGHDTTWLPAALKLLREELPGIHVVLSTQNSPQLGAALLHGGIDVAFMRKEDGSSDLEFKTLIEESFEVFLPVDHPLAAKKAIDVQDIAGQNFISVSGAALSFAGKPPALRRTIDRYLKDNGIAIKPNHVAYPVNPRHCSAAALCKRLSAWLRHHAPSAGLRSQDRSVRRISKGQLLTDPEAVPLPSR
jgi:LysR family hca operon transcriptional activator